MTQLVMGLGMPMIFIPLTALAPLGLPRDRVANAAGLKSFIRVLVGAVGGSLRLTY
jgi:DHA2 family multidrug resistance protein